MQFDREAGNTYQGFKSIDVHFAAVALIDIQHSDSAAASGQRDRTHVFRLAETERFKEIFVVSVHPEMRVY